MFAGDHRAGDRGYPRIIEDAIAAIHAVRGVSSPTRIMRRDSRCLVIQSLWRDWPIVFPQHGAGKKHEREISLERWQHNITRAEAEAFVRGLIHSDGCRFIARQRASGKVYCDVRYSFKNKSDDIRRIYCDHLDLLGVRWTQPSAMHIDVNRAAQMWRSATRSWGRRCSA